MNAGKEFEYYTYSRSSTRSNSTKAPEEDDYFTFKTKSFKVFNMKKLYGDAPNEKIQILQEIYDTERTYVMALTVVNELFIPQLNLVCPKSKKCFRSMFGEISAICKTHQILLEDLRCKPIAEVFNKFVPFLKLYTGYASHYPTGLKIFAKLMARNDFRKALTKIELDPRVCGKNLQAYLIMPIQRIPRYIMLIQNLMQLSTQQEDMTNLYRALSGMQALSEQIQSCMTAYENGERLLAIQLNFGLDGHILEPGRVLLKEGMLYKREINGSTNYQETVVFLFNDILLYGVQRIGVLPICKYEPSAILSLRHCIVQHDVVGGSIFIRCGDVGIDFTAYSLGGVTEWYQEICDAIDNAKKLRDTLRKESFKQKSIVFDRGFWQRHRDRLRSRLSNGMSAGVNRVFSRKRPLPKLDEKDFLRGQWGSSSAPSSARKRKTVVRQDDQDIIESKRVLTEQDFNNVTLTQPMKSVSIKSPKPTEEEDDSDIDFDWTDDEEVISPEKKIPLRRVASFDEEDRRPRNVGEIRRSVISEPANRSLAVDDIRKLSYQQRSLEPFNMMDENDDYDDYIDIKVKGERPRPWWETESAPPAIKNQKSSLLDSVRSSCVIM